MSKTYGRLLESRNYRHNQCGLHKPLVFSSLSLGVVAPLRRLQSPAKALTTFAGKTFHSRYLIGAYYYNCGNTGPSGEVSNELVD